jgi:hypothetical protein
MKKFNLPLVLDSIFVGICAFLLFFTSLRYYTKSATIGLIFGICAALLFGTLTFIYIRKKSHKKLIYAADERNKRLLSIHLSLCERQQVFNIFCALFDGDIDGDIIENQSTIYFVNFRLNPLSPDDIVGAITFKSPKSKVILCNTTTKEAKELAENFGVILLTLSELYPKLKEKNLLPEKYIFEGTIKPSFIKRVKLKFNRKFAPALFWCGLAFLFFSFFTFYPIYYIVTGGVFILFSAVCLVFGKR